eukprot:CAMPEP_0201947324 /NCGR_PEP_ID=MMETSP0903-20130614/54883_1 /ASSEMBLY_ACC=CAM_ASM_000552 /TAXON_ID=420261 /ORGANISM="Thalassiosira antarctica, Strain CCMP982" /LENGTH=688 /DNA_ID=CAMNT_0048490463 /DNA_START=96 /DNA_END=2163 /DNA_ORIENTATION=-
MGGDNIEEGIIPSASNKAAADDVDDGGYDAFLALLNTPSPPSSHQSSDINSNVIAAAYEEVDEGNNKITSDVPACATGLSAIVENPPSRDGDEEDDPSIPADEEVEDGNTNILAAQIAAVYEEVEEGNTKKTSDVPADATGPSAITENPPSRDGDPVPAPSLTNGGEGDDAPMPATQATLPAPNEPVYGTGPVQNDDKQGPWWKGHLRNIFLGIGLAVLVVVGVSLSSSNGANNDDNNESVTFVLPSFQPSSSLAPSQIPSLRPSILPSTSSPPSTYWSSLLWKQQGQANIGEAAADWLGWSTALSSDGVIMAIGAPGAYDIDDRPGYVKVYHRESNGSRWEQLGLNIEGATGDLFGISVALSSDGMTLAIGAPGYFDRSDRPGFVRVYYMEGGGTGSSWTQLGQDIIGEAAGDQSGISVALSADGKTLAIGANGNDKIGDSSGHVSIYYIEGAETGSSWKQLGQHIEGEAANDNSGISVDLSADGKILAIGAPYNDGNGADSGQVRVYYMEDDEPSWRQLGQDIDGEAAGDWSGRSVSLSSDGKTLAIGANGNDRNGDTAGHVKVYHMEGVRDGLSWKQLGQNIDGEAAGDQSGIYVALSADGTTLAIGANGNDSNGVSSGHVRVYYMEGAGTGSSWKQLGQGIAGEAANDNSGISVSLSADGKTVAIGSPWNGNESGQVRVFNIEY